MKEKVHLTRFIGHITNNNFKQANTEMAAVVNEKIMQRIRAANRALAAPKAK